VSDFSEVSPTVTVFHRDGRIEEFPVTHIERVVNDDSEYIRWTLSSNHSAASSNAGTLTYARDFALPHVLAVTCLTPSQFQFQGNQFQRRLRDM
jgi:hypothetical protein